MNVAVAIPFRAANAARERNYVAVRDHYEAMGLRVVSRDSEPGTFAVNVARNRAMADAEPWDVCVVNDADVVVPGPLLRAAVDLADRTGSIVQPAARYWRQREDGSYPPEGAMQDGGCHVWSRAAYGVLHGYDPGFVGWGGNCMSLMWAAVTLGLFHILDGDAQHLYHPRFNEGESDWFTGTEPWMDFFRRDEDGKRPLHPLAERYHDALYDPEAMRALLAERANR